MSPVEFEIEPPPRLLVLVPLLVGLLIPAGVVVLMLTTAPKPTPWAGLAPAIALPFVALGLAWSMFRRKLLLSDAGLRIRSLPWPRVIPVADIDLAAAEIVDLRQRPELRPWLKIAGSRLPGYRSGRFRLRDRRKASVLITDPRRVLVLPLRDGSLVMLSAARPDALLAALRRAGESRARIG